MWTWTCESSPLSWHRWILQMTFRFLSNYIYEKLVRINYISIQVSWKAHRLRQKSIIYAVVLYDIILVHNYRDLVRICRNNSFKLLQIHVTHFVKWQNSLVSSMSHQCPKQRSSSLWKVLVNLDQIIHIHIGV